MKTEIKGIRKKYGKQTVLRDVSFCCESGECIGILGKNGSGKSTLFNVLCGLLRGDGEFICDGTDLMKNAKARSRTVGFVPQSPPLMNELTARDNLLLWYSSKKLKNELCGGILEKLGINEFLSVPVSKMSGGMKKRLAIGCSVANDPVVLLLDEPSAALDLTGKERIGEYLRAFRERGGIAVIATHDVYELEMCDRVYILSDGVLTLHEGERDLHTLAGLII